MPPGAYEGESKALLATVAVNYCPEEDNETTEEISSIGNSRSLFGSWWCVPFVRPTNPKQAYFVGVVDICLATAIAVPPHLAFKLLGAQIFVASWLGMRFFGYWFFRNDTTPLVEYHCADYEHRLNGAVPKELQVVPFKWPMTVFDVPFFLEFGGMFVWFYVSHPHWNDESPPSLWPWFSVPAVTTFLFLFFWMNIRIQAYVFRWRQMHRWALMESLSYVLTNPARPLCYSEPILSEFTGLSLDLCRVDRTGWQWFKRQQASMWTAEEIDSAKDLADFLTLSPDEQAFVKTVAAFFASADSIIVDNLIEQFGAEVNAPNLKQFLVLQAYMENIHAETYANIFLSLVKDSAEQTRLFNTVQNFASIWRKAEWMHYWTSPEMRTFSERLIAFAAIKGIFFSGSFCAIFWLKKHGLLPGLSFANELIARDKGMHRDFAVYIHTERLQYPATPLIIRRIIEEAVDIETEFIAEALPASLIGMNAMQMTQYVQFVADHLLVSLHQPKLYHATNPFDWMEMISLQGKTNFFEKHVSEYALSGVGSEPTLKHDFNLDSSL